MNLATRLAAAWKRRVWIHLLRRTRPEAVIRLPHANLTVDLRDRVVASLLYLEGNYEHEVQRLFSGMDLSGAVCVDVGGHMGSHTLLLSKLVGPQGRVYAFEPQGRNFAILEKNVRRNAAANVTATRAAVGDREGTCRLAVHPDNFGDHRVAHKAGASENGVTRDVPMEEVPMVTLDSALAAVPDGAIQCIKIDVQGYETYVVRGMRETLRRNPGAILFIEVCPEALQAAGSSASELVTLLRELGLNGWEFHDFRLIPLAAPFVYDLIRGGKYTDLVLSRGGQRITDVLRPLYGASIPAPA